MKNRYILLIIQALLTSLLFFSEGYMKYATIGFILLFDLVLFIGLFRYNWSYEELLTFAAIICSGLFIFFYLFAKSSITLVFGILIVLLFLALALLNIISRPASTQSIDRTDKIQRAGVPEYYHDTNYQSYYDTETRTPEQKPEPVMHVRAEEKSEVKSKLTARAVAYELEREAKELKNAQKMMKDMEIYDAENELLREKAAMEDAQKNIAIVNAAVKDAEKAKKAAKELKKETKEIAKVQKQISEISKLQQIEKEAKELKNAEKRINELKYLDQQEKIVKQAKAIAKAQKEIDGLKKKPTKPVKNIKTDVKTAKSKSESFYFSTETGNKFHEPGCIALKKVPKNKLILFTNKKEALKKGLQPCSVCIPK